MQESPCAGGVPEGWAEVVGQATPQAWHLLERLECGQETEKSPGAKNIPPRPSARLPRVVVKSSSRGPKQPGFDPGFTTH